MPITSTSRPQGPASSRGVTLPVLAVMLGLAPACGRDAEKPIVAQPITEPTRAEGDRKLSSLGTAPEVASYAGRELTVRGTVDRVLATRAFQLESTERLWAARIPVITSTELSLRSPPLAAGDQVVVTGIVRANILEDLERELGWDLPPPVEAELGSQLVLVASSLSKAPEPAP